jgi:hypothetical protein
VGYTQYRISFVAELIVNGEWHLAKSQYKNMTFELAGLAAYNPSIKELVTSDSIVCASPQICCLPENTTNLPASNSCDTLIDVPSFLIGLGTGLAGAVITACFYCYFTSHSRNAHHAQAEAPELHQSTQVQTELGVITV